jgi:hypothetical protein
MTDLSSSDHNNIGKDHSNRYRIVPQGMMTKGIFLGVLSMFMVSCQNVSANIEQVSIANANDASDNVLSSIDASQYENSETVTDNTETSSDDSFTFVEGRGYIVTWPPEERFVISPPDDVRKAMAAKCADEGYITAYITSMELHSDKIIGYFLCRGIGG